MSEPIINDLDGHGSEKEIFAFISVDENGKSGICAASTILGVTPMVGMTLKDMDKYFHAAEQLKNQTGKEIKLIRYKAVEVIGD